MVKQYVLKMSSFYLSKYILNGNNIKTSFISGLIFATDINKALRLTDDNLEYLKKILYIETGIDFEIKEVEQ